MQKILFVLLYVPVMSVHVSALQGPSMQGPDAYVIRVDSDTVYFDTTSSSAPASSEAGVVSAGDSFVIFEYGDELISPITGSHLGRIKITVAAGTITEIEPKYAVGRIDLKKSEPKPGQRVRFQEGLKPNLAPEQSGEKLPVWQSSPIAETVLGITLGDINGDGINELITLSSRKITAYTLQKRGVLKTKGAWEVPRTRRFLSVEAADLKNTGADQIYVCAFSDFSNRIETYVLEWKDGKFVKKETLKWLVANIAGPGTAALMYSQQLFNNRHLNRSGIRRLLYRDGKFTTHSKRLKKPRLDWIYGFSMADINGDGEEDVIYITGSDRLRIQFKKRKDYWESADDFGKTPNRLEWMGEKLRIYPRLPVIKDAGGQTLIYGIVNIPKSGLLAESFGRYKSGELHCFRWSSMAATPQLAWKAPVDGYISGIQYGKFAGLPNGLIISTVGTANHSILMLFEL